MKTKTMREADYTHTHTHAILHHNNKYCSTKMAKQQLYTHKWQTLSLCICMPYRIVVTVILFRCMVKFIVIYFLVFTDRRQYRDVLNFFLVKHFFLYFYWSIKQGKKFFSTFNIMISFYIKVGYWRDSFILCTRNMDFYLTHIKHVNVSSKYFHQHIYLRSKKYK